MRSSAGVGAAATLSGVSGAIGGSALLAGAVASGTIAVTGATTAMTVSCTPNTFPGNGISWMAYVSAAGTVTVVITAIIAATPAASTYNVRVHQ